MSQAPRTRPRPSFFSQPSRAYRDFHIVFTLLSVMFVTAGTVYVVDPASATRQFSSWGRLLGEYEYTAPEARSRLWRYLGAANVMTLGVMCLLMQCNLRRFSPILPALVFLKGYNAALFFSGYLETGYPPFVLVALFDGFNCFLFVVFARRALRDIAGRPDSELIPKPRLRG